MLLIVSLVFLGIRRINENEDVIEKFRHFKLEEMIAFRA
jgi:hypothetical protein